MNYDYLYFWLFNFFGYYGYFLIINYEKLFEDMGIYDNKLSLLNLIVFKIYENFIIFVFDNNFYG